jgi:hypothetical protein
MINAVVGGRVAWKFVFLEIRAFVIARPASLEAQEEKRVKKAYVGIKVNEVHQV